MSDSTVSAIKAIDEVHQDPILSLQETLKALQELQDHVSMLIEATKEDIEWSKGQ